MSDDGFVPMGETVHVRIEGDLVVIRNDGVMTLVDLKAIIDVYKKVRKENDALFVLYDNTRAQGVERAARKALTTSQSERPIVDATAIFGASFAVRTLANMIDRALIGLGRRSTGIRFFETEAQARAYLDEARRSVRKNQ